MAIQLVIIFVMVIMSAFFSACETAFTGVNKIRVKHISEQNGKNAAAARIVLNILDKYDKALSTVLIGSNIVNISTSSIVTIMVIDRLPEKAGEEYGALISTVAVTLIIITLGEIIPKTLAKLNAENFCLLFGGVVKFLMFVLTPVSACFLLLQKGVLKIFDNKKSEASVTEEELKHIIDEIEDESVLEEQEANLVRSALDFDETTVGEILTPRVNVVAVSITDDAEKVRNVFANEGYSRLPVYDKTIDHIKGTVNAHDFIKKWLNRENFEVLEITQEAIFVPELMKISEALKLMQKKKLHMAVVIDQYGGTQGIITLEDILEELVGEIWDESDEAQAQIEFKNSDVFELSGQLSKNDFNRYFEKREMNFEITSDCNTVGGWVFELFGKIPKVGDVIKTSKFKITVMTMEKMRPGRLKFLILNNLNN